MSDSFSTDDSDEDELPSFRSWNPSNTSKEKSLKELLKETISLKNNIKLDKNYLEDLDSLISDASPPREEVPPVSSSLSSKENEKPVDWYLFGKLDSLQYFALDELSLWKCGYYCIPSEELSNTERCLLSCSEEELVNTIDHALKGITVDDVSNLNPIIRYIVQVVSVHVDVATVNCCVEFIKKMVSQHTGVAGISFSSGDIFMILFNYGVDIANGELFQMFPAVKTVEAKLSCTYKLPVQWKYNLRTVLNCLADIFQYCKFNKDDLYNILIYLLWMSVDKTLKASFVYQELQKCLCNVILSFTDKLWPFCLFGLSRTLISENALSASKNWSYVLDMTRAIPFTICRGVQLRKRISFVALRHLCGLNTANMFRYPCESSLVPELQDILESFCGIPTNLQNTALSFLAIFVMHIKFVSKEDHNAVCSAFKMCENSIKNRGDLISSLPLQHQLMRIYTSLKLAPPESYETVDSESDSASESDSDDGRTECIVENDTEYAYPIALPPMTADKYVPSSDKPSTYVSKRVSGYFSDEDEAAMSLSVSSTDDSSSDSAIDDSNLSEYESIQRVLPSCSKDKPSDDVSVLPSESKLDGVSCLHSLNSSLQDTNNLSSKDNHVETFITDVDAMTEETCSVNFGPPAALKTDTRFSGSGMGSLDARFQFSCDGEDQIQTPNDNDMHMNICTMNQSDNSMLVSSDEGSSTLSISKSDEFSCTGTYVYDSDAQDPNKIFSSLASNNRESNSKDICNYEGFRSSENCLVNPCDSVFGDTGVSNSSVAEADQVPVSSSQPNQMRHGCSEDLSELSPNYSAQTTKDEGPIVRKAFLTDEFLSCVSRMKIKKRTAQDGKNLSSSQSSAESNSSGVKKHISIISVEKEDSDSHDGNVDLVSEDQKVLHSLDKTPVVECIKENMFSQSSEIKADFVSSDSVVYVIPLLQQQNLSSRVTTNNHSLESQGPTFSSHISPLHLKNKVDFISSDSVVYVSSFHQQQNLSSRVTTNNHFSLSERILPKEAPETFTELSDVPTFSGHKSPLPCESKADFISSGSIVYVPSLHQQQNLMKRVTANNHSLLSESKSPIEIEENCSELENQYLTSDCIQKDQLDTTYQNIHEDDTSLKSFDATHKLETITHDFRLDGTLPSATNELVNQPQIISKDVPSISSMSSNYSLPQNISQLQDMEFSNEAADETPNRNISLEIPPKLNGKNVKETIEVLKQYLPPESLDNNYVLIQNGCIYDDITKSSKSEEENITAANMSQNKRKFHDEATSKKKTDEIASVIATEIRLPSSSASGSFPTSLNNMNLNESMLSDESESFPISESILPSTKDKNYFCIESAGEGTEAQCEFSQNQPVETVFSMSVQERSNESFDGEIFNSVPVTQKRNSSTDSSESESVLSNMNRRNSCGTESANEDTVGPCEFSLNQPVVKVYPVSIQDRSSEPFHPESFTSVSEMQKHTSLTDSSNQNSATSALNLKNVQDCLRKALSSLKPLNASAPESSDNSTFVPPAHFILSDPYTSKGRNTSEKPFVPFLSEEEGCFTSSFAVPQIKNVVRCELNFLKENSFELETNSVVPDPETYTDKNTSMHLNGKENRSSDSDDIEIIEHVIHAKGSKNGATHSSAKSAPPDAEHLPTSPSAPSLSKKETSTPALEKNSELHTHASTFKPSTSFAHDSSAKVTPSSCPKKVPPVQVHGPPDDSNRFQPTIPQYLSPSSEHTASTSALTKETCSNGSSSSTPERRKSRKRSLTPSQPNNSILPYLSMGDARTPNGCKRRLYSNNLTASQDTSTTAPLPSASILQWTVPGTSQNLDPKQDIPLDNAHLQSMGRQPDHGGESPLKQSFKRMRRHLKTMNMVKKGPVSKNVQLKEERASPVKRAKLPKANSSRTSANISPMTVQNFPSTSTIPASGQNTISDRATPRASQESTYPKQDIPLRNERPLCGATYPGNGNNGESSLNQSAHIMHRFLNSNKGKIKENMQFKEERTSPFKRAKLSEASPSQTSTSVILTLSDSDSDIEVLSSTINKECVVMKEVNRRDIITLD